MRSLITRRSVMRHLGLEGEVLDRLEQLQIIIPVQRPRRERAYTPDDVDRLRLYRLLVSELEVNPAGAEIILQLRSKIFEIEDRLRRFLRQAETRGRLADLRDLLRSMDED